MKTSVAIRKWIFVGVPAGILLCLLYISFHPFNRPYPEPQYQGKKLTEWAEGIYFNYFYLLPAYQRDQRQNQAIAAIRQIGTNALPVALELCRAKDPWIRKAWEKWTYQYYFPGEMKRYEGVNIIWALGPMTKPIVPALVQLLQGPETAGAMMDALPGAGTNAIPPLIKLLSSPDKEVRLRAAITLGDFFQPKKPLVPGGSTPLITSGSEDFRSQAAAAVPVLLQSLNDPDTSMQRFQTIRAWGLINTHLGALLLPSPSLRPRAIRALGLIREDAPVVVPILVRHIRGDTNWVSLSRRNYYWALGCFGTNAESAVPVLVHLLKANPEKQVGWEDLPPDPEAARCLWRIDPNAAKPFVKNFVEKYPDWITNWLDSP